MNKIDPELRRILVKRIAKVINHARYEPGKYNNPEAMAEDVVRPFLENRRKHDPQNT